jgi:hypothetical protein
VRRSPRSPGRSSGQALLLLVGALLAVLVGAVVLGAVARGIGDGGDRQRAADLGALAAARAMRAAYPRVFEPVTLGGRPNPRHLERGGYVALGRDAATDTARRNGARRVAVAFPGAGLAPVRVRVTVSDPLTVGRHGLAHRVRAEAELASPGELGAGSAGAGEYRGPLALRQGKPMRPDVARAFDRLEAAARADGIELVIASAFRTDAEQARLFAAHPDPAWVAPPGRSLHRLGTELDLGPAGAYAWLARHAARLHFVQRYAHEPWHYGYALNAGTASLGYGGGDGRGGSSLPDFVPARFAAPIARAAQRWSVSATLLAAQIYRESSFNPFARSGAGALGISQLMPGTARAYGVADPFDPGQAIDAQAHLMRDLLRDFGSVPLALAAYNAGPRPVRRCGCVPAIPETQAYVADILGLLHGAGDALGAGAAALEVRLVR